MPRALLYGPTGETLIVGFDRGERAFALLVVIAGYLFKQHDIPLDKIVADLINVVGEKALLGAYPNLKFTEEEKTQGDGA